MLKPNSFACERLTVDIYPDRQEAGAAGASIAAEEIQRVLAHKSETALIFASAVSQEPFLAALRNCQVDWKRITVFHLDEYAGISPDHPASFRRFLRERLLDYIPVRAFHQLNGKARDLDSECRRYAALLREAQPEMVALGIGENGHLAFIDPHSCDFNDPEDVRVVELDYACRLQQVHDGAFTEVEDVPRLALSITIPVVLRVPRALIFVNGESKSVAVRAALEDPIIEACPASALRQHNHASMFLDEAAASRLNLFLPR